MGKTEARQLAETIATDLFTDCTNVLVERLVLERSNGRNMGGWCYDSVAIRVSNAISPIVDELSKLRAALEEIANGCDRPSTIAKRALGTGKR